MKHLLFALSFFFTLIGNAQSEKELSKEVQKHNTQLSNVDESIRKRLTDPKLDSIPSELNCKIYLILLIDEKGNVADVRNITSQTNTSDPEILTRVMESVKKLKYSEKLSAELEKVYLTINLNAN